MLRRLKRLAEIIRSEGFVAGMKWLLMAMHHRFIPEKQVVWCNDLTAFDANGFKLPDHVEIQRFYSIDQMSKEDLKILMDCKSELMGSAASILIHERFNKGAVLWLLKENRHIAGYRWTIVNNHVTPTYVPHTKTDVHSVGAELFVEFQGRSLIDLFLKSTLITLKDEGFKRYYAETYLQNKRALKAFSRIGLHKIGTASRFSIFGKNVVIWHDVSEEIKC